MIKLSNSFVAQTKKIQEKKTTEDVNESIVNDLQHTESKIFSAADLWNIQRRRKMMLQRRWSF